MKKFVLLTMMAFGWYYSYGQDSCEMLLTVEDAEFLLPQDWQGTVSQNCDVNNNFTLCFFPLTIDDSLSTFCQGDTITLRTSGETHAPICWNTVPEGEVGYFVPGSDGNNTIQLVLTGNGLVYGSGQDLSGLQCNPVSATYIFTNQPDTTHVELTCEEFIQQQLQLPSDTVVLQGRCCDSVIIYNKLPINTCISGLNQVCEGSLQTLAGFPSGTGLSYQWSTGETTQQVEITGAGLYQVTVTDQWGCSGIAEHAVSSVPCENLWEVSNDCETHFNVCWQGPPLDTIPFSLQLRSPKMGKIWSFPNATCGEVPYDSLPSGDFVVEATFAWGNGNDTNQVTCPVKGKSKKSFEACCPVTVDTFAFVCSGDQYMNRTFDTDTTFAVAHGSLPGSSCGGTVVHTIDVIELPVPVIAPIDTLCTGQQLSLVTLSQNVIEHQWTLPGGQTIGDSVYMSTVDPDDTGWYHLAVTDAHGCTNTDSVFVTVYPKPSVEIEGPEEVCPGELVDLQAHSIPASVTYVWSDSSTGQALIDYPAGPRTYTVTVTSQQDCMDSAGWDVTIIPFVDITSSFEPEIICNGDPFLLKAEVEDPVAPVSWFTPKPFPFQQEIPGRNVEIEKSAVVDHRGWWTVRAINSLGCESWDTLWVQVYAPPRLLLPKDVQICEGKEVTLKPELLEYETPLHYLEWTDENGKPVSNLDSVFFDSLTTLPDLIGEYPVEGTYTLLVVDSVGCKREKSTELDIRFCCEEFLKRNDFPLSVPNIFSPNGDGFNDVIGPVGQSGINIRTFQIFDRWGERVYKAENFSPGELTWNGKFRGKRLSPGVLIWHLEAEFIDDTICPVEMQGTITLIK